MSQERLETPRLILEPFGEDHVPTLARMAMNPEIMRYIRPAAPDYATAEVQTRQILMRDDGDLGVWGLRHKADDTVIGLAILRPLPDESDIEVGYRLDVPYWGKGLATEAARCLIDHGFGMLKLETIVATFDAQNDASRHVLEKCGLKPDGMTTAYHDEGTPLVRINRSDWRPSR